MAVHWCDSAPAHPWLRLAVGLCRHALVLEGPSPDLTRATGPLLEMLQGWELRHRCQ